MPPGSALATSDPTAVLAALGTPAPTIRDGYRMRPVNLDDAKEAIAFVTEARHRLTRLEGEARQIGERVVELRRALTPERAVA